MPQPAKANLRRSLLLGAAILVALNGASCGTDAGTDAAEPDAALDLPSDPPDAAPDRAGDPTDVDSNPVDAPPDLRPDVSDAPLDVVDAAPAPEPPPRPEPTDEQLAELQVQMTAALSDESVAGRQLTGLAVDLETGRVLFESDPDLPLVPASNTKLFTTAAAFALLGEDHRFRTRVFGTTATDDDGLLAGDLIVIVEHDFTFSADFYASPRFPFDQLAAELYGGGLRQIGGSVRLSGELGYDAHRFASYDPQAHRVTGVAALSAALTAAGISHDETETSASFEPPDGALLLAAWSSVPLSVACVPLNSISHNEYADILLRHLGYSLRGQSTYADGFVELAAWLAASGLDTEGFTLSDGSGLSYANQVSARHVVGLYKLMDDLPSGAAWLRSMSIGGVRGTLAGRLGGTDTAGRVFGKSGTLNISIATSGVLFNRYDGRRYAFSFIMNDIPSQSAARLAQDAAVTALSGDLLALGARPATPELEIVGTAGDGRRVTASWAGVDAIGYVVWRSSDGSVWRRDETIYTTDTIRTFVADPADEPVYVRVTAVSEAGESDPSDVYAASPAGVGAVLIVDGNERWQRQPVSENSLGSGHAFVVDYAEVLGGVGFGSASARAVRDGLVDLGDFDAVLWGVAEESTTDESFDSTEQAVLAQYAATGGNLLVSGAEIGWDLVEHGSESDAAFFGDVLKAGYIGDDAGTYLVRGSAGLFAGLPVTGFYTPGEIDVAFPERLEAVGGGQPVLVYLGGTADVAGVAYDGEFRLVHLGFPFESVDSQPARAEIITRILSFFELAP